MKRQNWVGRKFHQLTVTGPAPDKIVGKWILRMWECRCDCGGTLVVKATSLKSGNTKSCGCRKVKHGQRNAPEYAVWRTMLARCNNPKHKSFHDYGGRGIKVCERWMTAANFFADMGQRPSARHTIERINNSGNYEPSNCRWATMAEQCKNRRNSVVVTAAGQALSLSEWAQKTGIGLSTIKERLRNGWSPDRAVSEPVRRLRVRGSRASGTSTSTSSGKAA